LTRKDGLFPDVHVQKEVGIEGVRYAVEATECVAGALEEFAQAVTEVQWWIRREWSWDERRKAVRSSLLLNEDPGSRRHDPGFRGSHVGGRSDVFNWKPRMKGKCSIFTFVRSN
jgi:hypothetical protein